MRNKRKLGLLGIPFVILVFAGGAFAAWIVLQGLSGSGAGKVGASTISPKITLTANTAGATAAIPGTDGLVGEDVLNNDTVPVKILTLSASSIVATPTCNTSGLTFVPGNAIGASGTSFAPGTSNNQALGSLHAAANLDPACANANISVTFTGTTN